MIFHQVIAGRLNLHQENQPLVLSGIFYRPDLSAREYVRLRNMRVLVGLIDGQQPREEPRLRSRL
jgi:hypothetical protein